MTSTLRRIAAAAVAATALSTLVLLGSAGATTYTPTFASWTDGSNGSIGSVVVTMTGNPYSTLTPRDLTTADYVPAGSATQTMTMVERNAAIAISFSVAVTNPAIYFTYLRGLDSDGSNLTLSSTGGTCTWSIQSGLTGASISGSTLIPQATGYSDGVLLCTGTITSLTIDGSPGGGVGGAYDITVALLDDPSATTTTTTTAPVDPATPSFTG